MRRALGHIREQCAALELLVKHTAISWREVRTAALEICGKLPFSIQESEIFGWCQVQRLCMKAECMSLFVEIHVHRLLLGVLCAGQPGVAEIVTLGRQTSRHSPSTTT